MLVAERRKEILALIREEGKVTINNLVDKFNISAMTAWRDLNDLDKKGLLEKVHGGAIRKSGSISEEPTFKQKSLKSSVEKEKIARRAVEKYIQEGDIISIGGGSTILKMVPYLRNKNLTIYTNGLQNIVYASKNIKDLNLISSGGAIRHPALIFAGEKAEEFFSNVKTKSIFLSATGLTKEGIWDPHPLDSKVKQAMCKSANKIIILMDSTKLDNNSLEITLNLDEIDVLITDNNVPEGFIKFLEKKGIEVEIVE